MKKFTCFAVSLIFTISAAFLTSCTKDVENKGYIAKFSDFSKIKPGSSKSDVINELGSPSTTSMYGEETWYYIGKEQTKETIFDPEVTNYDAYSIVFNGDVVSSITKKDKTALKEDVEVSEDTTKTSGNEITVWQQLFGNLGKFNPASRMNKGVQTGVTPGGQGPRGY